ncbi:hypothetical protein OE88DRAFT_1654116 [Heliocybe sulcata]|uniref:Uncharacterized protein n=1 Tax=Heliocybe sulcata TaxID=5364 RepID=A0A5C3NEA3_9AGAM|nr:hypothetical protein OE88DRAFT_1654116 [Heliocybe sulcata]
MLSCLGVLAFAFVSSAIAQSNYNYTYGDLQAEAATAHFTQARIIPPLLGPDTTFMPQAYLNVSFPGIGQISFGQTLSPDQVQQPPNITVTFRSPYPLNANVSTMQTTVVLEDVGPAGHNFTLHQTRTWLVYNATLKGADGEAPSRYTTTFAMFTSALLGRLHGLHIKRRLHARYECRYDRHELRAPRRLW